MSFTTIADLEARLAVRLDPIDGSAKRPARSGAPPSAGDPLGAHEQGASPVLTPAAVLAPIVRRPQGWTLLLTLRTESMPTHAGQVAFPGGRTQDEDDGPVGAALRETWEEIGLSADFISPLGRAIAALYPAPPG